MLQYGLVGVQSMLMILNMKEIYMTIFVLSLVVISLSAILLLAVHNLYQSFVLSFHLQKMFKLKRFDTFGLLSKQYSAKLEINKPKIYLACIIFQQNMIMLLILSLVMMALLSILMW